MTEDTADDVVDSLWEWDVDEPSRSPTHFHEHCSLNLLDTTDDVPFMLDLAADGSRSVLARGAARALTYALRHAPALVAVTLLVLTAQAALTDLNGIERLVPGQVGVVTLVLRRADLVIVPSAETKWSLSRRVGSAAPIEVVSNGVDLDTFRPVDADAFRRRHDLEGTLIGYTGRHGYEKRLGDLLRAAERLAGDPTVVFGGGGPATADLKRLAAERDVDARFLGVLDRGDLPAFYSALDVFGFPSGVETEGIVGMEAMACGTPAVGADAGALRSTVREGETGYRFEPGSVPGMADALRRAVADRERLAAGCLDRRDELSMAATLDRLESLYRRL